MNTMLTRRVFEIEPCGDPYNRTGWDVFECIPDDDDYRWHLAGVSPIQGRDRTIAYLRRMYPGCIVRVCR